MAIDQNWQWVHNDLGTVDLQTLAWNISTFGGRHRMAGKRGGNIQVGYRDGSLWTPKDYDENEIDLAMWVLGCEEDGAIPADAKTQFWTNLRQLERVFATDRTLGFLHKQDPVEDKQLVASAEVQSKVDFRTMAGATRAAFIVRMVLPFVWFRDLNPQGETIYTTRANAAQWNVDIDSDVMMKDPFIEFNASSGAVVNPKLYNLSMGGLDHWVVYNGSIGSGSTLVIDVANWRATLNGTTRVTGAIDWSGQPQMFWLKPGVNQLRYEGSGSIGVKVGAKGAYW